MINPSEVSAKDVAHAQKKIAILLLVSGLLTFATNFLMIYVLCLFRAMVGHKSYVWIKWPLPHYVTPVFLSTLGCGTAFLFMFVIILWAVTLHSVKHSPKYAQIGIRMDGTEEGWPNGR